VAGGRGVIRGACEEQADATATVGPRAFGPSPATTCLRSRSSSMRPSTAHIFAVAMSARSRIVRSLAT